MTRPGLYQSLSHNAFTSSLVKQRPLDGKPLQKAAGRKVLCRCFVSHIVSCFVTTVWSLTSDAHELTFAGRHVVFESFGMMNALSDHPAGNVRHIFY